MDKAAILWASLSASARPSLTGTKSGSGSTPNSTTGKPAAELKAQPLSGTAKNSTYRPMWVAWWASFCQPGMAASMAGGSAGGDFRMRVSRRTAEKASTSTPAHLCQL